MSHLLKVAQEAIRAYPRLKAENEKLAVEVAQLKKEKRVRDLQKLAEQRGAGLPDEVVLMKLPGEKLAAYETALEIMSSTASLSLGSQEQGGEGGQDEQPTVKLAHDLDGNILDPITAFCADPLGVDVTAYAQEYERAMSKK